MREAGVIVAAVLAAVILDRAWMEALVARFGGQVSPDGIWTIGPLAVAGRVVLAFAVVAVALVVLI